MNVVDTSGWIEYFFDEPNAEFFKNPIARGDDLVVPVVCLYELYKKVQRTAGRKPACKAVAPMRQGRVVPLSVKLAVAAAEISLQFDLAMAASIIYATARAHDAVLWTQDEALRDLPGVKMP